MKTDALTKTLLALIALGLFLNASDVIITKAFASVQSDISYCMDRAKIIGTVDSNGNIDARISTYC